MALHNILSLSALRNIVPLCHHSLPSLFCDSFTSFICHITSEQALSWLSTTSFLFFALRNICLFDIPLCLCPAIHLLVLYAIFLQDMGDHSSAQLPFLFSPKERLILIYHSFYLFRIFFYISYVPYSCRTMVIMTLHSFLTFYFWPKEHLTLYHHTLFYVSFKSPLKCHITSEQVLSWLSTTSFIFYSKKHLRLCHNLLSKFCEPFTSFIRHISTGNW